MWWEDGGTAETTLLLGLACEPVPYGRSKHREQSMPGTAGVLPIIFLSGSTSAEWTCSTINSFRDPPPVSHPGSTEDEVLHSLMYKKQAQLQLLHQGVERGECL